MPDIRLQDYVVKIRDMIREVRLDEAIRHGQHILTHYPRHIETYCLLGEACLEKEMYRDAIESFQRALSADPESLIARVGLGVIYDEQGALPEAIWQLERAFELAPGSAEVRQELQRLYARHGAGGQARLKLTRGALGRLYSRNGLYERAIGEFHAVLRQEPDLPDIRVALAESLWREGRRLEAVEVCLEILEALPNCLKANLILGQIWTQGGNEEAGEEKLKVARALDPENRVAQEMMGSESPLPLEDVFIPELDSVSDRFEPPAPSDVVMATAAGELLDEEAEELAPQETAKALGPEEELPDWLRDVGVTAEEEPSLELEPDAVALDAEPAEEPYTEEMPEWLQEFVGEESPAEAEEPAMVAEEEGGEVEPAVSPDRMGEQEEPEVQEHVARAERDISTGAAGLGAGLAAGVMVAAGIMHDQDRDSEEYEELPPPAADEVPEWLQELVEPEDLVDAEVGGPVTTEGVGEPAMLAGDVVEGAPPESEVPASLQALVAAGLLDETDLDAAMADMSTDDLETQQAEDVPDWLQDLIEEPEAEVPTPATVEAPEEEALPPDEVVLPVVGVPEGKEPDIEDVQMPIVGAPVDEVPPLEDVGLPVVEAPEEEDWPPEEAVLPVVDVPPVEDAPLPIVEPPVAEGPPEAEEPPISEMPPMEEIPLPIVEAPGEVGLPVSEVPPVEEHALPVADVPPVEDLELPVVEVPAAEDWLAAEVPPLEEEGLPISGVPPVEEVALPAIEERVEEAVPVEEAAPPAIEERVEEAVPVEEAAPPAIEERVEEAVPVEEAALPAIEERVEEAIPVEEAAPPAIEEPVVEPLVSAEPVEEPPVEDVVEGPSRAEELEAVLRSRPRDYGARLELARLYRDEQEWNASLAQYEKLVSARKHLPKVRDELESMLEEDVNRAQLYQLLGDIDMQQDDLDRALEMYRLARQSLT